MLCCGHSLSSAPRRPTKAKVTTKSVVAAHANSQDIRQEERGYSNSTQPPRWRSEADRTRAGIQPGNKQVSRVTLPVSHTTCRAGGLQACSSSNIARKEALADPPPLFAAAPQRGSAMRQAKLLLQEPPRCVIKRPLLAVDDISHRRMEEWITVPACRRTSAAVTDQSLEDILLDCGTRAQ